jgi:hypothetical protein
VDAILADSSSSSNLASRAVESVHRIATHHTKGFARDLRIAFGAVLLGKRQQTPLDVSSSRVVYCKANNSFGSSGDGSSSDGGDSGNGNGSGSGSGSGNSGNSTRSGSGGSGTSTGSTAGPSGSAVSSPWKLAESHVSCSLLVNFIQIVLMIVRRISRVEEISLMAGTSGHSQIQLTELSIMLMRILEYVPY